MPKAAMWTATLLCSVAAFGVLGAEAFSVPSDRSIDEDNSGLSLAAAEHLALSLDPVLAGASALQAGFSARSQAASTLPDPKLKLGVVNISAESFKFDQEPMTQAVVGLSQSFPPSGLREAASNKFSALAQSQDAVIAERTLKVRQQVRHAWLELFYQRQAKALVLESEDVFVQLSKITQYQYRAGRGNQQHVVRAQLEQSLLIDRATEIETKRRQAQASLEKWIGSIAGLPDMIFPSLPPVVVPRQASAILGAHPSMRIIEEKMVAARYDVDVEKSRKNPAWMLDVSYGRREADRDDLMSAVIKMDLPLFAGARQDQLVAAGRLRVDATELEIKEKRRALHEMYSRSVATYQRTSERIGYFKKTLLPQAKQNTEAALNAYQSGVTDFGILVRARLTELNSRLKYLRLKVDRAKSTADIAYLLGEPRA